MQWRIVLLRLAELLYQLHVFPAAHGSCQQLFRQPTHMCLRKDDQGHYLYRSDCSKSSAKSCPVLRSTFAPVCSSIQVAGLMPSLIGSTPSNAYRGARVLSVSLPSNMQTEMSIAVASDSEL